MHFLNPGFLGGQKAFRKQFTLPIEKHGDEKATKRLRQLTRPFILRRLKTDPTVISDLPEKQEVKVYCNLSEEQATLYEAVVQDALHAIEEQEEGGIARKGMVLSMLMQLKQVCNHPVQYLHQGETYNPFEDNNRSGKLRRFHAILDEVLAEGDRLLLFSSLRKWADCSSNIFRSDLAYRRSFCMAVCVPKSGRRWCTVSNQMMDRRCLCCRSKRVARG